MVELSTKKPINLEASAPHLWFRTSLSLSLLMSEEERISECLWRAKNGQPLWARLSAGAKCE